MNSQNGTVSNVVPTAALARTILIVDDDPSVTETFERMLRLEGYNVVTALSAVMLSPFASNAPFTLLSSTIISFTVEL